LNLLEKIYNLCYNICDQILIVGHKNYNWEGKPMDEKLVCPCGLTCCDCLFYKKEIYETAHKLKELIQEYQLDKFLTMCSNKDTWAVMGEHLDLDGNLIEEKLGKKFNAFEEIPAFMNVLDGIIKIQCKTTCQEANGCSTGGETKQCKALKCLKSRKYNGCWQCNEFENCDKLKFLKKSYGYVIEDNLKTIKENGVSAVKSRGNQYYKWQRGTGLK